MSERIKVQRVQTGVRMEKRLLKVLKSLAEYLEMSLGDLLEGITLHAFEGKAPFKDDTLKKIAQMKTIFGVDYGVEAAHKMLEED